MTCLCRRSGRLEGDAWDARAAGRCRAGGQGRRMGGVVLMHWATLLNRLKAML
jgi:hypothetical protein